MVIIVDCWPFLCKNQINHTRRIHANSFTWYVNCQFSISNWYSNSFPHLPYHSHKHSSTPPHMHQMFNLEPSPSKTFPKQQYKASLGPPFLVDPELMVTRKKPVDFEVGSWLTRASFPLPREKWGMWAVFQSKGRMLCICHTQREKKTKGAWPLVQSAVRLHPYSLWYDGLDSHCWLHTQLVLDMLLFWWRPNSR